MLHNKLSFNINTSNQENLNTVVKTTVMKVLNNIIWNFTDDMMFFNNLQDKSLL